MARISRYATGARGLCDFITVLLKGKTMLVAFIYIDVMTPRILET